MPLGFSRAKGRSIVELAAAISGGTFEPAAIETLDDRQALQTLLQLRGVGRWTAEYALLRGLGRLHVFPGDDVGARNNLARWLDCRGPLDYAAFRPPCATGSRSPGSSISTSSSQTSPNTARWPSADSLVRVTVLTA